MSFEEHGHYFFLLDFLRLEDFLEDFEELEFWEPRVLVSELGAEPGSVSEVDSFSELSRLFGESDEWLSSVSFSF